MRTIRFLGIRLYEWNNSAEINCRMKKVVVALLLVALCAAFKQPTDSVFICDSATAIAYHKIENCRGLNKCTHTIKKITMIEAINTYKRRACKICYK